MLPLSRPLLVGVGEEKVEVIEMNAKSKREEKRGVIILKTFRGEEGRGDQEVKMSSLLYFFFGLAAYPGFLESTSPFKRTPRSQWKITIREPFLLSVS